MIHFSTIFIVPDFNHTSRICFHMIREPATSHFTQFTDSKTHGSYVAQANL